MGLKYLLPPGTTAAGQLPPYLSHFSNHYFIPKQLASIKQRQALPSGFQIYSRERKQGEQVEKEDQFFSARTKW